MLATIVCMKQLNYTMKHELGNSSIDQIGKTEFQYLTILIR